MLSDLREVVQTKEGLIILQGRSILRRGHFKNQDGLKNTHEDSFRCISCNMPMHFFVLFLATIFTCIFFS